MNDKKTIVIIEPQATGHYMNYARYVAREALRRGHNVKLLTFPISLKQPSYLRLADELRGKIETYSIEGEEVWWRFVCQSKGMLRQTGMFVLFRLALRNVLKKCSPDIIFLPFLDYCYIVAAIFGAPFGRYRWVGTVLYPTFQDDAAGDAAPASGMERFKKRVFSRLMRQRSVEAIFTINRPLFEYIRAQEEGKQTAQKFIYVADPVEVEGEGDREAARKEIGVGAEDMLILVYGVLSERKGIDVLLTALETGQYNILLAGQQSEEVRKLLMTGRGRALREEGRIFIKDRYLNAEEEYRAFLAADIVWLGYRGFGGESGVLIQAGRMGLPVVACKEGIIGALTEKEELGISVDIDDKKAVADAIRTIEGNKTLAKRFGENGRVFAKDYTPEAFAGAICDVMERGKKRVKCSRKMMPNKKAEKRFPPRRLLNKCKKILILSICRINRTKIILSAGICRSGSTWLFNAARLLLSGSSETVKGVWIDDISLKEVLSADILLIKTHHYDQDYTGAAYKILYSIRDLRDVASSIHRIGGKDWETIVAIFNWYVKDDFPKYKEVADFSMRYEEMISTPEKVLTELAACLGIHEFNSEYILEELDRMSYFSSDNVNEDHNRDNMMHKGHRSGGRPGGWGDTLPKPWARLIEEKFEAWLRENDYLEGEG